MTQQGYPPPPPGQGFGQFPGYPGIPQQQAPQAPQPQPGQPPPQAPPYPGQPAPGAYPPPPQAAPPGYGGPPGYGPPPGQPPMVQVPPPGAYPPAPGYGPPQGNPYAQPGAPPGGYPGAPPPQQGWGQPMQPRGFNQAPPGRLDGRMMQGVDAAGARHPFMTCMNAQQVSQWLLEVALTKQSQRKGSFVVEFVVHWTDFPGVEPKSMRSWVQNMNDKDIALPSVKRFVLSALGFDSEPAAFGGGYTQQHFDHLYTAICDDENHLRDPQTGQALLFGPNPLKGRMITCVVNPPGAGLNQKGQPKVYQRHDFSPRRQ